MSFWSKPYLSSLILSSLIVITLTSIPDLQAQTQDPPKNEVKAQAPDINAITTNGLKTYQDYLNGNISIHIKSDLIIKDVHFKSDTLSNAFGTKYEMSTIMNGKMLRPLQITMTNKETWIFHHNKQGVRYRNYELPQVGIHYYLHRMDFRIFTDPAELKYAKFERMHGHIAFYRQKLDPSQRQVVNQMLQEFERFMKHPKFKESPEFREKYNRMKDLSTKGVQFSIDTTTGLILSENNPQFTYQATEVNYPKGAVKAALGDPSNLKDHTQRVINEDFIIAYTDTSPNPAEEPHAEVMMLNTKTGERYRVPSPADTAMWAIFTPDRSKVYVSGIQTGAGCLLYEINLKTGETTFFDDPKLKYKIIMPVSFSADGKKLMVLATAFHNMGRLQFNHAEIDLEKVEINLIPCPADSFHFQFHPSGKGYIYRQIDKATNKRWIYHYIDKDTSVRLIEGDNPTVIQKGTRILFEKGWTWYTCNLEGKDVKLFHGGLADSIFAKLSYDEQFFYFTKREQKQGQYVSHIYKMNLNTKQSTLIPNQTWFQIPKGR